MTSTAVADATSRSSRPAVVAAGPEAPVVRRSLARRLLALVLNAVLVLCLLAFVLVALGPHLFGYRTATMLTGSMEPGIAPGDVVVAVEKPATDVAVGDILSYHIPVDDHRVESHRVIEVIHNSDGSLAIRTKGDNNAGADPWTATLEGDTVWEVRAVIPKLGSAIRTLRSPTVQHGIFWIAFGGLLVVGLSLIWGRSGEDVADREHGDGAAADAQEQS